ncbi:hypothetical protein GCM10027347_58990 [Larkinella harenae]
MLDGLKTLGIAAVGSYSETHVKTEHVACWGWRTGKILREKGHHVLVMERGYLGDRFRYTSLGWNGLNGRAVFPLYADDGGERFRSMAEMKEWAPPGHGKYILLMGQVPHDQSLAGRDLMPWYVETAQRAAEFYQLPVVFRQHPDLTKKGLNQQPLHVQTSHRSMEEDLAGAALVIAYNSNSAVDAVLHGIPTLTFDEGAMAWPVTGHAIGEEFCPDRRPWAHALAWKQWDIDEIRSGKALSGLLSMV